MTLPDVPLLNRENAILEFNRRVLAQAQRVDVPLLERLRYICIVSSNLDEFFEVRFADMLDAQRDGSGLVTPRDVERVGRAAHDLIDQQYAIFNDQVMPALREHNIQILNHADRTDEIRAWVSRFFEREVRPLLVPVGLDPAHPFPQVANKSLHFIARLSGKDALGRDNRIAIVKVPRVLPRVIKVPAAISGGKQSFVLLTSVIRAHLEELFPGRHVEAFSQFRVTRDSDLEVDEEEIANLRHALRSGLTTRHFGRAVRLEVVNTCPEELSRFLLEQFDLPEAALYRVNGPVNLVRLNELIDQTDADDLRFRPYEPSWPTGRLPRGKSILDKLRTKGDVMLHHPFESFEPVVQLLREAVEDPDVLAIKQTIYRTGSQSVLADLLIEAARRGKEVLAVVELKARFDEEANINWAERLEAVGAQVVYGIVGLKTHAKLMLITRREGGKLRRYGHLSTGNYNPKTARFYTDLGYLTADAEMTADMDLVFRQLASLSKFKAPKKLLLAPFNLHRTMVELLSQVEEAARRGEPARVVLKINALTDAELINGIVRAGRAGAKVDLIVRGACMLPPGLPGETDNILVRSVVGRFLEHSRIFYFRWGKEEQEALYLSSADWMARNMLRRIEVAWPITDPKLRQRVIDEGLTPYLHDSLDAWQLGPDGTSQRIGTEDSPLHVSAQQALMRLYHEDP
ncbi:polyphosphate kinase [Mitsuaria sp. BK045]|uniref:polyphosphate kinase 1 n=1 Tax=unclassified Roseateles TaxID=2626991 RepID=UPI001608C5BF|nr:MULTISPECIES: polyphosphate kinase 1 [unclassified Roseateles]MBB3294549.1 polyphosphate kinase [Mitsuaria sp. BK041]MBB3363765.1 polyphosphate kinase [Mitsuaria sp. BK045]